MQPKSSLLPSWLASSGTKLLWIATQLNRKKALSCSHRRWLQTQQSIKKKKKNCSRRRFWWWRILAGGRRNSSCRVGLACTRTFFLLFFFSEILYKEKHFCRHLWQKFKQSLLERLAIFGVFLDYFMSVEYL